MTDLNEFSGEFMSAKMLITLVLTLYSKQIINKEECILIFDVVKMPVEYFSDILSTWLDKFEE